MSRPGCPAMPHRPLLRREVGEGFVHDQQPVATGQALGQAQQPARGRDAAVGIVGIGEDDDIAGRIALRQFSDLMHLMPGQAPAIGVFGVGKADDQDAARREQPGQQADQCLRPGGRDQRAGLGRAVIVPRGYGEAMGGIVIGQTVPYLGRERRYGIGPGD